MEKRTVIINAKVKPSERDRIREAADKEGITVSDYIRIAVLNKAIRTLK